MPSHWASSTSHLWKAAASFVLSGIVLLVLLSFLEARWLREQPWSRAVWTEDHVVDAEGAREAWSRELSIEQSHGESTIVRMIQEDLLREVSLQAARAPRPDDGVDNPLDTTGLLNTDFFPRAKLLMLPLTPSDLEPILASGRLPEPGKREVLAGPLLSDRDVVVDGQVFNVTGTIYPQAAGLIKVYLLPADPAMDIHFKSSANGKRGTFLTDASVLSESLITELGGENGENGEDGPTLHGGPVETRPFIAWGVWFGLLLVAVGTSIASVAGYRRLARLPIPVLSHAMQEIVLRPRLAWALHAVYFGGFFGAMALGLLDTELNYFFTQYASHEFSEGNLKYVGDAYESGNFAQAAHATYHNNFVLQTLELTALISLLPPFVLGLAKIMLSFVVVGFAMAPLWSGTAAGMSYHAITLGLELPPYILVGFGVAVWAQCIIRFLWSPMKVWYMGDKASTEPIIQDAMRQVPRGLLVLVGCTLLSAVLLYIAAWYEAVTLISFR